MKRANPKILVVDDDPDDLLLIESAFRLGGIEGVRTAASGKEAMAYLAGEGAFSDRTSHPYPDILISDLKMPNGDGFSILEHFKKNPESAVYPTVILSGSQDSDDIKQAYLWGASAYHVKPSSAVGLRTLVKALHDYWVLCEVPPISPDGKQLPTNSSHKLGRRLAPPPRQ